MIIMFSLEINLLKVSILLTCGKHLHDNSIMTTTSCHYNYKISLTLSLFFKFFENILRIPNCNASIYVKNVYCITIAIAMGESAKK